MSLNPVKISGTCGRLMCCLRYEQEAYDNLFEARAEKNGAFVQTEDGYGSVTLVNLLRQNVKVKLDRLGEAQIRTYDADGSPRSPAAARRRVSPARPLSHKPKKVRKRTPSRRRTAGSCRR